MPRDRKLRKERKNEEPDGFVAPIPEPPDVNLEYEDYEREARWEALTAPIEVIRERLKEEGIDSEQVAREILDRVLRGMKRSKVGQQDPDVRRGNNDQL